MFRTMLVEDNDSFRRVLRFYLQSEFPSMDIVEAANGAQAITEIDSYPPHLIFMNIQLPGESGLELTRRIKTSHQDIIIIIFTSYDLPESRELAAKCKADYFFSKGSIATGEIATLVKSILLKKGFRVNGSVETFELKRKERMKPLILKRRIWWEPVPGAISYIVYASRNRTIFDPDNFSWETTPEVISKRIIGKTEVILPDDWPEFPEEPGTYYIGITSRDDLGNQSEPFLLSGLFKFVPPRAPSGGGIDFL